MDYKYFNPTGYKSNEVVAPDIPDNTLTKSYASESSKALNRGVRNFQSGILNAGAAVNDLAGDTENRNRLEARAQEVEKSAQPFQARISDYRDVKGFQDALDYATGGFFESLPYAGSAILSGGAGRVGAKLLGAGKTAKDAATAAGVFTGMAAPETGFTYDEIRQKTGERMPIRSFAAGAGKAALDTFSGLKGLGNVVGKGGVKDIANTAIREGTTESLQEAIDLGTVRQASGEDVFGKLNGDDTARLVNAGLLGAAAGTGFSASGKALKKSIEAYKGKNPEKTLDDYLREKGVSNSDGSYQIDSIGGNIQFSKMSDSVEPSDLGAEQFDGTADLGFSDGLGDVTDFNDPDVMLNNKGMAWINPELYRQTGVANPTDSMGVQMDRLNKKYAAENPLFQSQLQKMVNSGASKEKIDALYEQYAPYERRPYSELVRRIAAAEGVDETAVANEMVQRIVESNPRFAEVIKQNGWDAGSKIILDNAEYIEKAPEYKNEQLSGFSDSELFGKGKDDAARRKDAIIVKPKSTKEGKVYRGYGEVPVEITNSRGKRELRHVNLQNLIKHSMKRAFRKEGQTLEDYVAEAMYSGLAELMISRVEANTSNLISDTENRTKAAKGENVFSGLSPAEKEGIVVYSQFRKDAPPRHITLAEVESTGVSRAKHRVSAMRSRLNRLYGKYRTLNNEMNRIVDEISRTGVSQDITALEDKWKKARRDIEVINNDLEYANKELEKEIAAEKREAKAQKNKYASQARDEAIIQDPSTFDAYTGQSAAETGVPDYVAKEPVNRTYGRDGQPTKASLFNVDKAVEQFESSMKDGDYKTATSTYESIIQALELAKENLYAANPKTKTGRATLEQLYFKYIGNAVKDKKSTITLLKNELITAQKRLKELRRNLLLEHRKYRMNEEKISSAEGNAALLDARRRHLNTLTDLERRIDTAKKTVKELNESIANTPLDEVSTILRAPKYIDRNAVVKAINRKVAYLNQMLTQERYAQAEKRNKAAYEARIPKYEETALTGRLAAVTKNGNIKIDSRVTRDTFFDYIQGDAESDTSKQKAIVLEEMSEKYGITLGKLKKMLDTDEKVKHFLAWHEQDHIDNNDRDFYWKKGKDFLTPDKVAIELRANMNALRRMGLVTDSSIERRNKLGESIKAMHSSTKGIYSKLSSELPGFVKKAISDNVFSLVDAAEQLYKEHAQEVADAESKVRKELSKVGLQDKVYMLKLTDFSDLGLASTYLPNVMTGRTQGFAGTIEAFKNHAKKQGNSAVSAAADNFTEALSDAGYEQIIFTMPFNTNATAIDEVIRHEVGHTVLNHYRGEITGKDAEAIMGEFEAWVNKQNTEGDANVLLRTVYENRPSELVKLLSDGQLFTYDGNANISPEHFAYMRDFEEWFADKTKERLMSEAAPRSALDRLIDKIIDAFRAILNVKVGDNEGAVYEYVDRVLSEHSDSAWNYARTATETLVDVAADALVSVVATSESDNPKTDESAKAAMYDQLEAYFRKTLGRGVGPTEIDELLKASGIGTTDVISAAFHNSFVEAIDTLYSVEEKNVLMRAATAPAVIRQLRSLLQPYPRAFKEAQDDPKVAAAYMYQFWMTGHIKLGNQTKNQFFKAQGVLDDVIGMVYDNENAEHLMEEFIRGNVILAKQTGEHTYGIKKIVADTMIKRAVHNYIIPMTNKLYGGGGGIVGSLISSAQTRMMDTKNPILMHIATQVNHVVGREGTAEDMMSARTRRIGEYSNIAHEIFEGKSKEHGMKVIDLLNSGKNPSEYPANDVGQDAKAIQEKIMKPMHNYLKRAGLDVGEIRNYFPWVFDTEYFSENSHAFKNLLLEPEFAEAMESIAKNIAEEEYQNIKMSGERATRRVVPPSEAADVIVDSIRNSSGYADVKHRVQGNGIMRSNPQMSAINKRTLQFLQDKGTPEQKERLGKFFSDNLGLTLITYIEQGVKRAEYNRRFGIDKNSEPLYVDSLAETLNDKTGIPESFVYELFVGKDWIQKQTEVDQLMQAGSTVEYNPFIIEHPTKLQLLTVKAMESGATAKEIELLSNYMDAVMGTSGAETNKFLSKLLGLEVPPEGELVNPKLQKLMGVAMVYQNVRLLAMSAITSLADPLGIAVRTGDIGIAYNSMIAGIKQSYAAARGDKSTLISMTEMLGIIDREMTVDALNWEYGGVYVTGTAQRINEAFFRYNGLQALTRATRIMATEASLRFIKKHVTSPDSNSARYLSELNLNPQDVKFDKDGNIKVMNTIEREEIYRKIKDDKVSVAEKEKLRRQFMADENVRVAISRFVDTSILRPNATLRPIWASDPHFMLVFHLKSFMYAFSERILMRAYVEAQNSHIAPVLMLGLFIPAMLASDALRDLIRYGADGSPYKQDWGWADYTQNAAQRAGLYGLGQIGDDVYRDVQHGGLGLAPVIGPTLEQAGDIMAAAVNPNAEYDTIKLLPAYNVYRNWGE